MSGLFGSAPEVSPSWTSSRPYLCSFGDSIQTQDVPGDLSGSVLGVSPAGWANALCASGFDYLGPYETTITPTGGEQTLTQPLRNGMWGSGGGLVRQALKFGIDGFLADVVPRCSGRKFAVLLSGGVNDLSNTDVAGFDAVLWADYRVILQKIIDAGGFPIALVYQPSSNFNTTHKRRNRSAFASRVLGWAAGRRDMAVANVEAAFAAYGKGVTFERASRGVVGDLVHPNNLGATLYGFAVRDAMVGRMVFAPPWERSDFSGTHVGATQHMLGSTGTKGVNANAAALPPAGWTLNSFGSGTSIHATPETDSGLPGSRIIATASAAPAADSTGLTSSAVPAIQTLGPVYRAFVDLTVVKAQYATSIGFRLRLAGATFVGVGYGSSSDRRLMTDATVTAPFCPSAANLLEGHRVVLSTFPLQFPASAIGTLHDVGASAEGLSAANARLETQVRFAGLVQY